MVELVPVPTGGGSREGIGSACVMERYSARKVDFPGEKTQNHPEKKRRVGRLDRVGIEK